MRLGDLDALFCRFWGKADPFKEQPLVKPSAVFSKAATMAREAPTIDPETIPTVQELRAEIDRLTNNGKQDLWAVERKRAENLESELEKVTAERDKIKQMAKETCEFCMSLTRRSGVLPGCEICPLNGLKEDELNAYR